MDAPSGNRHRVLFDPGVPNISLRVSHPDFAACVRDAGIGVNLHADSVPGDGDVTKFLTEIDVMPGSPDVCRFSHQRRSGNGNAAEPVTQQNFVPLGSKILSAPHKANRAPAVLEVPVAPPSREILLKGRKVIMFSR